jgi:hypothetical protein
MILRSGPLLGPNSIIPGLPEANAACKKEIGPRGRLFPRLKIFSYSELDEPLLTEFAKDFWTLAQRRCGHSPSVSQEDGVALAAQAWMEATREGEAARGPRWRHFRNRRSRLANFAWFRVSHSQTTSSGS